MARPRCSKRLRKCRTSKWKSVRNSKFAGTRDAGTGGRAQLHTFVVQKKWTVAHLSLAVCSCKGKESDLELSRSKFMLPLWRIRAMPNKA